MLRAYASLGETAAGSHSDRMGSDPVRGRALLRRGVYAADSGSERRGSYGGVAASEPGVRIFRAGGLGDPGTGLKRQGTVWVCAHVRSDHPGPASGEKDFGEPRGGAGETKNRVDSGREDVYNKIDTEFKV